jgi:hypothetical protein
MKRLFGVPFNGQEQDQLSKHYLSKCEDGIKKHHAGLVHDEIAIEALRQISGQLAQYLDQIASRSQTLLAVVAILITIITQIGASIESVKIISTIWALASLSLFYNIWLFFGPTDNYADDSKIYEQTVALSYRRSIIFNGNIVLSLMLCAILVAIIAGHDLF